MDMPEVDVECDRCRRPVAKLTPSPDDPSAVILDGPLINGADGSDYWRWILGRRDAHAYRADNYAGRAGGFVWVASPGGFGERRKLVCIGRKHPRYERTVTQESMLTAYVAAVRSGRSRIGMADLQTRSPRRNRRAASRARTSAADAP